MPKQKSHKGLKKRVKLTAKGKVKRGRAGAGHLMSSKNGKRCRRLGSSTLICENVEKKIRAILGR